MKKTIIMTILMVFICFTLLGCGKSDAVKKVEALIDGIGEVTVDREESIREAEEAYNALTDKEKEQVENADQLSLKKEALEECIARAKEEEEKKAKEAEEKERKEQLAPFIGTWKQIIAVDWVEEGEYIIYADDLVLDENISTLRLYGKDVLTRVPKIPGGEVRLVEDNGITKLVSEAGVFVREEDYDTAIDKMFVHVVLDEDNIGDYIGGPIKIGKYLNEWGDETDMEAYTFESPAYHNEGLIMIASKDVKYEIFFKGNSDPETNYEPYPIGVGYGNPKLDHFGRVEGEIWYIREEFVDSISDGTDNESARKITFTDGFSAEFDAPSVKGINVSISDLEF